MCGMLVKWGCRIRPAHLADHNGGMVNQFATGRHSQRAASNVFGIEQDEARYGAPRRRADTLSRGVGVDPTITIEGNIAKAALASIMHRADEQIAGGRGER